MSKRMYNQEFSEGPFPPSKSIRMSWEDKRFLSLTDPLGIAAPFVLKGRHIFWRPCQLKFGWDEMLPDILLNELPGLENINVNRCYKPKHLRSIVKTEVRHFSDASEDGYGQCSHTLEPLTSLDPYIIHC